MTIVIEVGRYFAQFVAKAWAFYALEWTLAIVGILIFVNINLRESPEIYWVGAGAPRAVVFVGIKNLRRERFPSTR